MFEFISGWVDVSLLCPDPEGTLRQLTDQGIEISDLRKANPLTLEFRIQEEVLVYLRAFVSSKGLELKIKGRQGFFFHLRAIRKRPLLIAGFILMLAASLYLPGRILILQVEGNHNVPDRQILEAAGVSGIRFGTSARSVRSEKMKNALLSALPELQWAGVNTYGSRAVITVRERKAEQQEKEKEGVSAIVACVDAVVHSCTATAGTLLVTPGQAVRRGQTLISGYTDCGIVIRVQRAEGEIFADTSRVLEVLTPLQRMDRAGAGEKEIKISLLIGKKRINFYKGSGISPPGCVKMYSEYVLTLPGGFTLPVVLAVQQTLHYNLLTGKKAPDAVAEELTEFAEDYLQTVMVAGQILSREEQVQISEPCRLIGRYYCRESIGRDRREQIGVYHGKTD